MSPICSVAGGPFLLGALACLLPRADAQSPGWHRVGGLTGAETQIEYDTRRQRLVLVQTLEQNELFRTFERIDGTWSLRAPKHSPTPRQGFATGYDPARGRLVLFGGTENYFMRHAPGERLDDTWEYDGIDWQHRHPTVSPPAQYQSHLVFDPAAGQMLLCGGSPDHRDAWHYDGSTWTWRSTTPFYARDVAIASDPVRSEVVVLGSWNAGPGYTNRMYAWRGSSWQRIAAIGLQPTIGGRAMTWHAGRSTVIAHGGGVPGAFNEELWEWNGAQWSLLPTPAAPPRARHDIAIDPTTNTLIVAGGPPYWKLPVTVAWDGATWQESTRTLDFAPQLATWDGSRQRVVTIPKTPFYEPLPYALEWDGREWHEAPLPPSLAQVCCIAFDEVRGCLVMAAWDSDHQTVMIERDQSGWSIPTVLPAHWSFSKRSHLTWHGGRGRLVTLRGQGKLAEWDGSSWQSVPRSGGGPLFASALVWDRASGELLAPHLASNGSLDVPTWTSSGWQTRVARTNPHPVRQGASFGYDENRKRMVMFGGLDPIRGPASWDFYRFHGDTWEWDGTDWRRRKTAHQPAAREGGHLVFDHARRQLLLVGGWSREFSGAEISLADVWALDDAPAGSTTTFGTSCGNATQHPRLTAAAPEPGAPAFTLDLDRVPATAPCLVLLGQRAAPVALGHGCSSWLPNPAQAEFKLANTNGFASIAAAIPRALSGHTFTAQAAALDVAAPAGFAMTTALEIRIGY
ncbi:MAG: hypothetical protein NXI31_10905 [bacterium]|nr:hypothetical protein [bacterium]